MDFLCMAFANWKSTAAGAGVVAFDLSTSETLQVLERLNLSAQSKDLAIGFPGPFNKVRALPPRPLAAALHNTLPEKVVVDWTGEKLEHRSILEWPG